MKKGSAQGDTKDYSVSKSENPVGTTIQDEDNKGIGKDVIVSKQEEILVEADSVMIIADSVPMIGDNAVMVEDSITVIEAVDSVSAEKPEVELPRIDALGRDSAYMVPKSITWPRLLDVRGFSTSSCKALPTR